MNKAKLIFPALLLVVGLSAYGIDLQSYGFKVTNTQQANGQTVYTVTDPSGLSLTVATSAPLTAADGRVLERVDSTLSGWKNLKISEEKVVFHDGRADILVIPSSFVYKNIDLSKYMPSGIQFYYDKYLQYDFRMFKDNLFLRLKGEIFDESQFADRLYGAVQNPVLYLQTNNPEYLLQQINDLVTKVDTLTARLQEQRKALEAADAKLAAGIDHLAQETQAFKTEQHQFNEAQAAFNKRQDSYNHQQDAYNHRQDAYNQQQMAYNHQQVEVNQQQMAYNRQQEAYNQQQVAINKKQEAFNARQDSVNTKVSDQLDAIRNQASVLLGQFEHVRYSLLALNNRGFFGRIYPINQDNINRVVAMKKANPSLTVKQVVAKLKADGVKMSKKEVSLVFYVYFNEFK